MDKKHTVDKQVFGQRLKYLMTNFNETTYSMSRKFNLSPPSISRYTRGEMAPKITTIREMAAYFDVSPLWLPYAYILFAAVEIPLFILLTILSHKKREAY